MAYSVDEKTARKVEEEKIGANLAYCPFCGKGLFWIATFDLLVALFTSGKKSLLANLPNGWQAHKKCYAKHLKID